MELNANVVSLEKARLEAGHIYLLKGDARATVAKAIAESFNKALLAAKKDENFIVDGEEALLAIEEKVLEHYSKKAAGSIINAIAGFILKIKG